MGGGREVGCVLSSPGLHRMFRTENIPEGGVPVYPPHQPLLRDHAALLYPPRLPGPGQVLSRPDGDWGGQVVDTGRTGNLVGRGHLPPGHWASAS